MVDELALLAVVVVADCGDSARVDDGASDDLFAAYFVLSQNPLIQYNAISTIKMKDQSSSSRVQMASSFSFTSEKMCALCNEEIDDDHMIMIQNYLQNKDK